MATVEQASPAVRPAPAPRRKPRRHWGLPTYTGLVIAYLFIPIITMIVFAFNDYQGKFNVEWRRFTLEHWTSLDEYPDLVDATLNSLKVAALSTLIATVFGTLIALALTRYRFFGRSGLNLFIFLPMATPEIIMGVSLLALFVTWDMERGFLTVVVSHVMFCISYVVVTVKARTSGFDRSLEEAAQDLGATPWSTFWTVTFPLILPGVVAGAALAAVLSIDDYVVTSFNAGSVTTLPLWVYGASRFELPAAINVVGTITFLAGVVYAVAAFIRTRDRDAPPPILKQG